MSTCFDQAIQRSIEMLAKYVPAAHVPCPFWIFPDGSGPVRPQNHSRCRSRFGFDLAAFFRSDKILSKTGVGVLGRPTTEDLLVAPYVPVFAYWRVVASHWTLRMTVQPTCPWTYIPVTHFGFV